MKLFSVGSEGLILLRFKAGRSNKTLERMTTALTVFAKSGIAGAVVIRSAFRSDAGARRWFQIGFPAEQRKHLPMPSFLLWPQGEFLTVAPSGKVY